MGWDKGLGSCLIPNEQGGVCGRQIQEGEAIGTVMLRPGGPVIGHKACSDDFHRRKQEAEKQTRMAMVKRVDQGGPGGPINYSSERDALLGSLPLEKPEPVAVQADLRGGSELAAEAEGLGALCAEAGIASLSDLPFEATPAEAVIAVKGDAQEEPLPRFVTPISELRLGSTSPRVGGPLPGVDTDGGMVRLHSFQLDADGALLLDPQDAEDLMDIINAHIKHAWRQRP